MLPACFFALNEQAAYNALNEQAARSTIPLSREAVPLMEKGRAICLDRLNGLGKKQRTTSSYRSPLYIIRQIYLTV